MKNYLRLFLLAMIIPAGLFSYGQSGLFERTILQNGGNDTITLSNGQIIVVATSSDDAEQEQDAMDGLYDDDLDIGWEGDPTKMYIVTSGLRFQNITIPKGAVIDSAFLVFCSHEGKSAEDTARITIYGEASANAATFDLDNLITSRPATAATVAWNVHSEWNLWEFYRTPDIKSVIQEIVNQSNWQLGNSMAVILTGVNQGPSDFENAREVESFENIADPEDGGDGKNHPERVPKLMVYYTAPAVVFERTIVQNGANDTITLSNGNIVIVGTSSDDAEQEDDAMDALYDDDLDMGWEGDPTKMHTLTTGLRFQNITIPQGVVIDSAWVVFCAHEGKSAEDVAKISIFGEAADNAVTYDLDNLITGRPKTQDSVAWEVAEEWNIWEFYRTPDLRNIIQEIVDRPAWNYGNALALCFKGINQGPSDFENAREVESFENIADPEDGGDGKNHSERVPKLIVHYKWATGIGDNHANRMDLRIYPNPVRRDRVTIASPLQGQTLVSVYNIIGEEVSRASMNSGSILLNVSHLPAGIYFVVAKQGQITATQKMIVE
jgi:uncharacterized protein YlzI (FlbEa/FlbD family)